MEQEDETPSYLKFFNDGPHNYLLHSSEEALNDGFPVESIFTEMGTDWTLLSSSTPLISDGTNETDTNLQLFSEEIEQLNSNNVTLLSNLENNGVIVTNDVLLQVNNHDTPENKTITRVINGNTYSITYSQEETQEEDNYEESTEIIQLLNIDGSVTNIDKRILEAVKENDGSNFKHLYTNVQAKKCKVCSFLCESEVEIIQHVNSKHPQQLEHNSIQSLSTGRMKSILNSNAKGYTMYLCSTCGNGYSKKDELKRHMVTQHNLIDVSENETGLSSDGAKKNPARSLLNGNLLKKQRKSMKKIKCSIKGCVSRFARDDLRERHEQCHVNQIKNQFKCTVCDDKFSIWRICSMHLWKCHSIDLDLMTCPMCKKFKSFSAVSVVNHMAIHKEEKPFMCATCGNGFKQMAQLRNHEVIHKSAENLSNCHSSQQCHLCENYFVTTKSLRNHIKFVHEKFKPFICNICGHQTNRKEMLQSHYRQHTGDKPYHCSHCDFKTGDRNCLKKHEMRHFGTGKYSCPYCNYHSIQAASYKTHLANKHPGKEGAYACKLCKYTTVNCRSYLTHVKSHELKMRDNNAKVQETRVKSSEHNEITYIQW